MNKILIFAVIILLFIIMGFVIIILAKKYKKALENNKKLSTAIQNQKEIINAFIEAERKADEDKSKLGQGTNSERLNHTLNILQNIELNK